MTDYTIEPKAGERSLVLVGPRIFDFERGYVYLVDTIAPEEGSEASTLYRGVWMQAHTGVTYPITPELDDYQKALEALLGVLILAGQKIIPAHVATILSSMEKYQETKESEGDAPLVAEVTE